MKISDGGAGEEFGLPEVPALVYFENGVPELFSGDLRNDNQVIKWMLEELKQEEIKAVTVAMLDRLVDRNHNLAVLLLDETTGDDEALLAELENIDDECKKYDIDFVKLEVVI